MCLTCSAALNHHAQCSTFPYKKSCQKGNITELSSFAGALYSARQDFLGNCVAFRNPATIFPRKFCRRDRISCDTGTRANSMYMENFTLGRRLTFANLSFCDSSRNFFPRNLGAWYPWRGKSKHSARVFSAKIVFFLNWPSFLPPNFSLYGIASSS